MVMHELARGAGMPGALSCAAAQWPPAQAAHIEALLIEAAAQANFKFIVRILGQTKLKLKLCQLHRAMSVTFACMMAEYERRREIFIASLLE